MSGSGRLRSHLERYVSKVITSEDMSVIDDNASYLGMAKSTLMENAGANVARTMVETYGVENKVVLVVAGTGNNGGDGFVAARHLLSSGAVVRVAVLGREVDIKTEEARANWNMLSKLDVDVEKKFVTDHGVATLREWLGSSDFVVDAILGTGVSGNLSEPISEVVKLMNGAGHPILSVDTPTGLNPSSGEIHGVAVRANVTVTFHKNKRGFQGKEEFTGKVIVADIGIPFEAELFTGPGDVKRVVKARSQYAHKGNFGYVLVVGGSSIYSGAPALAAMAALRSGAGLTIIAAPRVVADAIRSYSPNLIVKALDHDVIGTEDVAIILGLLEKCDALILGPGIGLDPATATALPQIVAAATTMKKPILVDADAIRLLSKMTFQNAQMILTPHAGEFRSITGIEPQLSWKERWSVCIEFAKKNSCTLLLKGHDTVVTDGHKLKVNRTGNPGMATGGSGDVLSGVIGALLAQGIDPFRSGAAGSFIHGVAGDLAVKRRGFHLVATDIIDEIPSVLREFDRLSQ